MSIKISKSILDRTRRATQSVSDQLHEIYRQELRAMTVYNYRTYEQWYSDWGRELDRSRDQ